MAFALLEPTRHDVYPFIDPKGRLQGSAAGKTVLITGAGSGIGKAIAESFAFAGASEVILAARRTEPLEKTKNGIMELVPSCKVTVFGGVDISNQETVKRLFDALPSPPDVLISNAAVSPVTANIAESNPENWFSVIDINIKGSYLVARAYVDAIYAARKKGCLINVSSNSSWRYIPGRAAYATTKVAMNNMTEYLHREGESKGFRCVAMHPGGIITEMTRDDLPEDIKRILIDKPALPGATAVYLSTDRAQFLGGRFALSTWDMEELEKHEERIKKEDLLKTRVLGVMD